MADTPQWPTGVSLRTVNWGKGVATLGEQVGASLTVTPIFTGAEYLLWQATGDPWVPFSETVTSAAGEVGSIQLPATTQVGWVDGSGHAFSDWFYRIEIVYSKGTSKVTIKRDFQLPIGTDVIDLDRLIAGDAGVPTVGAFAYVATVNGVGPDATGNVNVTGGEGGGGADAREVQLRNSGTAIEWRYVGDTAWQSLASLASLTGPAGTNGREVILSIVNGFIAWRYNDS